MRKIHGRNVSSRRKTNEKTSPVRFAKEVWARIQPQALGLSNLVAWARVPPRESSLKTEGDTKYTLAKTIGAFCN